MARARLARIVSVTHMMLVWVCSLDTVISVSRTIVDVSTTTTTTVAIWVTVRVTVWYEMAVTVMGVLDKWLISKPQSLASPRHSIPFIVDLRRHHTLARIARLAAGTAAGSAAYPARTAAVDSVDATGAAAGAEVDAVAKAKVRSVGEAVPAGQVDDAALLEAGKGLGTGRGIVPSLLKDRVAGDNAQGIVAIMHPLEEGRSLDRRDRREEEKREETYQKDRTLENHSWRHGGRMS